MFLWFIVTVSLGFIYFKSGLGLFLDIYRIIQINFIDSLKNGEITIEEFVEFCKYVQDIPTLEHRRDELQHKVNILSLKTDPS